MSECVCAHVTPTSTLLKELAVTLDKAEVASPAEETPAPMHDTATKPAAEEPAAEEPMDADQPDSHLRTVANSPAEQTPAPVLDTATKPAAEEPAAQEPMDADQLDSHLRTVAQHAFVPDVGVVEKHVRMVNEALFQRTGAAGQSAVAETEHTMSDDEWFWIDDNTKAMELFALPTVAARYSRQLAHMRRFIVDLSPGPFFFRREATPRLVVEKDTLADFYVRTGLLEVRGDLTRGYITAGYRFHDGRDEPVVVFQSHHVAFDYGGKHHTLSFDDHQVGARITPVYSDGSTTMSAVRLEQTSRFLGGDVHVCTATLVLTMRRDSVYPRRTMTVAAPAGVTLGHVVVRLGFAHLAEKPVARHYNGVHVAHGHPPGGAGGHSVLKVRAGRRTIASGPTRWFALYSGDGQIGTDYAVVTVPESPETGDSVVTVGTATGTAPKANAVEAAYALGTVAGGREATHAEHIVLLAGGLYFSMRDYDAVFANVTRWADVDLSISYDYGAEVHTFATLALVDAQFRTPQAAEFVDRHLAAYDRNFLVRGVRGNYPHVFRRGLAFAIVAVENMYRATGDAKYREWHARYVRVIKDSGLYKTSPVGPDGRPRYTFGDPYGEGGPVYWGEYVDEHAAAAWALARAALFTGSVEDATLARDAMYNLAIIVPQDGTGSSLSLYGNDAFIKVYGKERGNFLDNMKWSFKAGLIVRYLRALRVVASMPGFQHLFVPEDHDAIDRREALARAYITICARDHGRTVEVLTSWDAGETNSETLPWVIAGLADIDGVALTTVPPRHP